MDREKLLAAVSERLGRRTLVWAGIRGDDVEPLADLEQLGGAFSIVNAYSRRASVEALAIEDLTGTRVDLEGWDLDHSARTEAVSQYRAALLRSLAADSALLPYRPSGFLAAIWFARRDRCINLGLFAGIQSAFEHKPWVETCIADLGIPRIPWTYIADEDQLQTIEAIPAEGLILRRSRTSGGEGLVRVTDASSILREWPASDEGLVSVAPYLSGALPVNVAGTAWNDGVTLHRPSVQLIGLPGCVTRAFGYCGNDFGFAAEFERDVLDQLEHSSRLIGGWLRSFGYRGTFGIDFLVRDGQALFTEINPRFQGSTHASSQLSIAEGEACLVLEHVAAMLGMDAPISRPLREQVKATNPLAHLVIHWTGKSASHIDPSGLPRVGETHTRVARIDVATRPSLLTEPGGVVARLTIGDTITTSGFDLCDPIATAVKDWNASVSEKSVASSARLEV